MRNLFVDHVYQRRTNKLAIDGKRVSGEICSIEPAGVAVLQKFDEVTSVHSEAFHLQILHESGRRSSSCGCQGLPHHPEFVRQVMLNKCVLYSLRDILQFWFMDRHMALG